MGESHNFLRLTGKKNQIANSIVKGLEEEDELRRVAGTSSLRQKICKNGSNLTTALSEFYIVIVIT